MVSVHVHVHPKPTTALGRLMDNHHIITQHIPRIIDQPRHTCTCTRPLLLLSVACGRVDGLVLIYWVGSSWAWILGVWMTTTAMCVMVWQHHHRSVVRWALIGQWVLESKGAVRRDRTGSSQTPQPRHTRPYDDGTKDAARSPCARAHRDGGTWRPRSTQIRAFAPFAGLSRLAPTRQRLSRTFGCFTPTPPFLRTPSPVHGRSDQGP